MREEIKVTEKKTSKIGAVLVVGGGIAGIQSSLDLANSGFKVYLLDKGLNVGGRMTQLDKTFPTNDCAMCILAPKLVEVGRHENVQIITKAQLDKIEGEAGRFKVKIKKLPRYVIEDLCTGCEKCVEGCPVSWPSEFEHNLINRKAIHRTFPQAVPNIFAIDKKGESPCRINCPAGVNAQGYIAFISQGKFKEALELIKQNNPFPVVCGRVCHHPCEDSCNRKDVDEPVAINALKRFVSDWARGKEKDKIFLSAPLKKEKIAIIGSGPAGLTCAHYLSGRGYPVTIFEALPVVGGMLRVGIPDYRLPKDMLEEEIFSSVKNLGVSIQTGVNIGEDIAFDKLFEMGYSCIYIAVGCHLSRKLNIPGEKAEGVLDGVAFLKAINLGQKQHLSGKVVVVGGGNVAVDAARSAVRLGAKEVTILYRRSSQEMPAIKSEIQAAIKEGVKIHYLAIPTKIISSNGNVGTLECLKMRLGDCDVSGRRKPVPIPNSEFFLFANWIISAIGQTANISFLPSSVKRTEWGSIYVNPKTLATTKEGVFAGGDAVTGPATAIEAIASGHEAAISIERYLLGEDLEKGRDKKEVEIAKTPQFHIESKPRQKMSVILPQERIKNFEEFETTFSEKIAIEEAKRCFNCGGCSECLQCVEACEQEAIDHQMLEKEIEVDVGAVILALGFDEFDPKIKQDYGYGRLPNVISSVEFERILSSSGPYQGEILRPSDKTHPKRIAFIQCVGSRDVSGGKDYCSSVCCMYATKEAIVAKEHAPGITTHIYFMDMRAFGKGFEEYYQRAQERYGVIYRRCKISLVESIPQSDDLFIKYVTEEGEVLRQRYDLVVLSVGLIPPKDLAELSEKLNVELNEYGFIKANSSFSTCTNLAGVYTCGASVAPKDIPESVAQASAAAAEVQALLWQARGTKVTKKEYPEEIDVIDQEPRIGVFVCNCGINIAGYVNVPEVVEFARKLPDVVYVEQNLYTCSQDTQQKIKEVIKEQALNRVVVASCTPRTHEPLFQDTIREAGLNRYLFEMANIRDQCSWVHMRDKDKATEKAKELVKMAVVKAKLLASVKSISFPVTSKGLVIGGGLSGMVAALNLAEQGFEVYLVEKEKKLGGNLSDIHYTLNGLNPQHFLKTVTEKIKENKLISVYLGAEVKEVSGYVGDFQTTVYCRGKGEIKIKHGTIILATGAGYYQPKEYSYGEDSRIIRQRELENKIVEDPEKITNYQNIVMIQCVGSRCQEREYCSRICCSQAIKNALRIKKINPKANIFILYKDIRTYGFKEKYYRQARGKGVLFFRYDDENKPRVTLDKGKLSISFRDGIINENLTVNADILVLSAGIVPGEDNDKLAKLLKVPLTEDKFFLEAHSKLRPLDFAAEGIFLCGLAHSPRFIEEAIYQAIGAAGRAAVLLSQENIEAKGIAVSVKEKWCIGCGKCVSICPYEAREIDEEKGVAKVKEVLCQGCGACVAVCPSGATLQPNFGKEKILGAVDALL